MGSGDQARDRLDREPLVSVILPVFNRAASVARAIESALCQTYGRTELIIVDDGSTDATPDVIARYADRATILRQPNRGQHVARNRALRHAKGELVAFIDSDDAWLSDRLERQVPLMLRPEVGLVYGDVRILPQPRDGRPVSARTAFAINPPHRGRVAQAFVHANFVPLIAVLVRRQCLERWGGFSEESRLSADYLAWFRIALEHELDHVDGPVADYTLHEEGVSFDLGRSLKARIALFQAERERTVDPAARALIDRLLFNLGIQLSVATLRGRAAGFAAAGRLARRARSHVDRRTALRSVADFAAYQLKTRGRRLLQRMAEEWRVRSRSASGSGAARPEQGRVA
jgi:glycosyltransferase involved in cell wall biosynthesis